METLIASITEFFNAFGPAIIVPIIFFIAIGVFGQWRLYEKCNQPGIACLVPVWNIVAFLQIMGRPAWHMVYFLIPLYNIYFVIKIYIELCHCFGKRSITDYILIIIFNGFYVLYLGLSYEEKYHGPVYKQGSTGGAVMG